MGTVGLIFSGLGVLLGSVQDPQNVDPELAALRKRLLGLKTQIESLRDNDVSIFDEDLNAMVVRDKGPAVVFTTSFQHHARYTNKADGGAAATFLFGDARKVAIDVPVSLSDLGTPGSRGSIGLRLSRVLGDGYSVSAATDQIYRWGSTDTYRGFSVRVSKVINAPKPKWMRTLAPNSNDLLYKKRDPVTHELLARYRPKGGKFAPLFDRIILQLGAGNGRYAPEGALNRIRNGVRAPDLDQWGVFGGATFVLTEQCQFFARYASGDVALGMTIRPLDSPLYATLALADALMTSGRSEAKDGIITQRSTDSPRIVLTLGYLLRF